MLAPALGFPPPEQAPETLEEVGASFLGMLICAGIGAGIAWAARKRYLEFLERIAPYVESLWTTGIDRRDDLWDERQFVALVQQNRGAIDLGDVMTIYGWSRDRAYEEMTRLMVDYGGDVRVDEHGAITFHFEELASSAPAVPGRSTRPIWKVSDSPKEQFDASNNPIVEAVVGVVLLVPAIPWIAAVYTGFDFQAFFTGAEDGSWYAISTVVGLLGTCAAVVFLVGRRLAVWRRERRFRRRAPYIEWLRRFSEAGGQLRVAPNELSDDIVMKLDARIRTGDIDEKGRVLVEVPLLQRDATDSEGESVMG